MTQPQDFRDRAKQVRHAARSHLMELRAERINKRKGAMATADALDVFADSDQAQEAPVDEPEALGPEMPSSASQDIVAQCETEDSVPEMDVAAEQATDAPVSTLEADEMNDLAVKNAAMSEMLEDGDITDDPAGTLTGSPVVSEPLSPEQQDVAVSTPDTPQEDTAIEPAAPVEEIKADQTDLTKLPGAGPGLIWMLNECGIGSLADLGRADPQELSTELGIIGQILDIQKWVDFAQMSPNAYEGT